MGVGLKNVRIQIKRWGLNNYYNAQGCNQNFFRAGEVSWNQGTLINISLKKQKKKGPAWKNWEFFLLDTLITVPWIKILTQRWIKSGSFFDFRKRAGEASPLSPLVVHSMLVGAGGNDLQFSQKHYFSLETGV